MIILLCFIPATRTLKPVNYDLQKNYIRLEIEDIKVEKIIGGKAGLKKLRDAATKVIRENITKNFSKHGRPEKWLSLSKETLRKRRYKGITSKDPLEETGTMRSQLLRGNAVIISNGGNITVNYRFPADKNSYKYLVPLTGSRGSTRYRGANRFRTRRRRDAIHRNVRNYHTPPRPWDFIDGNDIDELLYAYVENSIERFIDGFNSNIRSGR